MFKKAFKMLIIIVIWKFFNFLYRPWDGKPYKRYFFEKYLRARAKKFFFKNFGSNPVCCCFEMLFSVSVSVDIVYEDICGIFFDVKSREQHINFSDFELKGIRGKSFTPIFRLNWNYSKVFSS